MTNEWQQLTLREAGVALIDCVHATPEAQEDGYPYVGIPQMKSGQIEFETARKITTEDFKKWTQKAYPQQHDVILSRRTNPGVIAVDRTGRDFALGQNLVILRSDGASVFPPLLRWICSTPEWWDEINKFMNVGAIFNSLKCADVPNFSLTIPPIEVQKTIAETLGALDDKIEVNRRMNGTLEAMARAVFRDWFVDFGPTRRQMAGASDPHAILGGLIQTPIEAHRLAPLFPARLADNGLPEGWGEQRIDTLMELAYGKALKKSDRVEGRIPVYGSGGVTGTHDQALVTGPGVIVGRKGTVGSLYWEERDFYPIDTVFYLKPQAPLSFCYRLLETLGLENMNTDAAVPGLNRNNVYRLEVATGDEILRKEFAALSDILHSRMVALDQENRTLAATRDLLLPKLMSGEIRLKAER